MTSINLEKILFELTGIGQIAIVNKGDSIRSVDIKRLDFIFSCCSSTGGVTNMANTNISKKFAHIARSKCFTNPSTLFMDVKCIVIHRDNSCRILSTMLKQKKIVIDLLINRINRKNSDNSTHNYDSLTKLFNDSNMTIEFIDTSSI